MSKVIIAGSRTITDIRCVEAALVASQFRPTLVISGTARGVDQLGEQWATARGITVLRMPANWAAHGKAAGPIRNSAMLEEADCIVVVWDGKSRGSQDMISKANRSGKKVYVHLIELGGAGTPAKPT
jgi:hypothetical protein